MSGPASLRSHQPSKTTLKTYGSRGKRSSTLGAPTGATRLFQWDRLENERKARLEQREQTRLIEKVHEDAAAATEVDRDIQLYLDSDSDDTLGAAESKLVATTRQGPRSSTEPRSWSTLGHIDRESAVKVLRGELEPPQLYSVAPSLKPQSAYASGRQEATTTKPIRQAMFREKPIFEESQEEGDGDCSGDEVLFRTPSFQVLQKLKELPKPRPIEPRVNPFGFDVLLETGSRRGKETNGGMASSNSSINAPSDVTTKSTLLESPTTKRSLEIFNRRAQQLVDLQHHREQNIHPSRALPSDETNMEIDSEYQKVPLNDSRKNVGGRSSNVVSMKHGGPTRIQNATPPPSQDTFDSAPDPEVGRYQVVQDDCVDLALGKRMSNIQITPQRLQAKQRKTHSHDPVSLPVPLSSSFLAAFENDPFALLPPKSANLFLDRDVPKDEEDDFDELFRRARQNRKRSPLPSSPPPLSTSQRTEDRPTSPSVLSRNVRASSALRLPTRHTPTFARTASSRLLHHQGSNGIHRSDSFEDLHSPFIDISTYNSKQETRQAVSSRIPSQEPTPPRLVIQQQRNHFNHPQQQLRVTKPIIQTSEPHHQPSQEGPPPPPRPIRQIRSLKRPPAPLVSSRKSIFRPTVNDLLAISDQQFFDQFRVLDQGLQGREGVDGHGGDQQRKDGHTRILNFETLLPECMTNGLTKIGEASYSEVYTVDLPIAQIRKQKQRPGRPSKNQRGSLFEPFRSSRLNDYVKEFVEDKHRHASRDKADSRRDVEAGAGGAKLVMKVMPFLYGESNGTTTNSEGSGRGRRTKGRRKSESSLLALEDIYREAMVSTQIMQHWRGFISGFGTLIVRGKYPEVFLSAWDRFCEDNGTESDRPDIYGDDQLYCIILLPYGGVDLEHCPLANWQQAWSVLAQIASALEPKEQAPFWFEHRDLHWGNILVKGTRQDHIRFPSRDLATINTCTVGTETKDYDKADQRNDGELSREVPTCGIIVQMIDFTLARVQGDKGTLIYMDLEKDQDLFRGQGDYQFDIYRMMRKQINKDWAASCPRTNMFWLHYIADKLLTEKDLKKPTKRLHTTSTKDDIMEHWCYDRVLAVSRMNLDRLDPSGKTPSATVLDVLLHNRPS
ncbi:MAG: hypothetical protein J3Q66DRAFT_40558 [Benniella sp.]|nr:MAG: hypothetical protein J3Q66DRAFT_40558 [Benniella sp.]